MRSGTFWLRYRTPINSGSGKCIALGFGLFIRIEKGVERTTVVDIFDIIQQVRDTGIHLKVLILILVLIDQEPKSSGGPQQY